MLALQLSHQPRLREQYPLWPWSHHHPEFGRNFADDASLPRSVGMQAICSEAGIRHGVFIGTDIPYIWTIDLCLTLPWITSPQRRSTLVSIKPLQADRYLHIDPLDRGPEKLEAERRYALQLGVHYTVGDASLYPLHQAVVCSRPLSAMRLQEVSNEPVHYSLPDSWRGHHHVSH